MENESPLRKFDLSRKPRCPKGHRNQQPVGMLSSSFYCPTCDDYTIPAKMLYPLRDGTGYEEISDA